MYTKRSPKRSVVRVPKVSGRAAPRSGRPSGRGLGGRLLIALLVAGFALFSYFSSSSTNEITGETQYIGITQEQEIAMGLQSEPQMIREFGGLAPDESAQAYVDEIGFKLVNAVPEVRDSGYEFDFHLLDDPETVNAFALPGGPIFITTALFNRLETEGQLAGVLGHEIGHVVGRHSAERIAKQQLTEGLTGAVVIATSENQDPNVAAARIAQMVGAFINMKYGREDELQSDELGVIFMTEAGYDPRALIRVMEILEEASGGASQPEFASTHPNPGNRIARIEEAIAEAYPNGIPEGLEP